MLRQHDLLNRNGSDLPTGRGRHPAWAVPDDPQPNPPVRGNPAKGGADMTECACGKLVDRARGSAISSAGLHSKWLLDRRDRRLANNPAASVRVSGLEGSGVLRIAC